MEPRSTQDVIDRLKDVADVRGVRAKIARITGISESLLSSIVAGTHTNLTQKTVYLIDKAIDDLVAAALAGEDDDE